MRRRGKPIMNQIVNEPAPPPAKPGPKAPRKTMPSRHRSSWPKWVVILVVLSAAGWAAFRDRNRQPRAELEYKTSPVTRGDVTQIVTANGSLNPVQLVEVGSQISGVITEIKADFNSRVKAGDIVAQIDPATYERATGPGRSGTGQRASGRRNGSAELRSR